MGLKEDSSLEWLASLFAAMTNSFEAHHLIQREWCLVEMNETAQGRCDYDSFSV